MAPLYDFQCECGIRFEGAAKVENCNKPQVCPGCGEEAPRVLPDDIGVVFNPDTDGSPVPQNTGVSEIDVIADRAIGKSAKEGWHVAEKRVSEKKKVLEETGANPKDLSRNPDGSYRVMSPEETGAHARANTINRLAMETLQERRENSSSSSEER